MKKIFLISIYFFLLSSCEKDDSLSPTPVIVDGMFVRLDITKNYFNFDDITNTTFGGLLTNPGGKVVKYNLYVRRTDGRTLLSGNFVLLRSITSFPLDLYITPVELASALGLQVSDLKLGDKYRFIGEAFDSNNNRADYYSLSPTIQSNQKNYKEAFRFGCIMGNNGSANQTIDNYDPQ